MSAEKALQECIAEVPDLAIDWIIESSLEDGEDVSPDSLSMGEVEEAISTAFDQIGIHLSPSSRLYREQAEVKRLEEIIKNMGKKK